MGKTRDDRLRSDYYELMGLVGPQLSVKPISGVFPCYDGYDLEIRVRSYISARPDVRSVHHVRLTLPAGYPLHDKPCAVMVSTPKVFNLNWYVDGRFCLGTKTKTTEGLGGIVTRMIQTLIWDEHIIDETSPANLTARDWYLAHKGDRTLFPSDTIRPVAHGMIFYPANGGK